jgi:lipoprotein
MKNIKLLFVSLLLVSCTVINKRTYYKLVYSICNNDYYDANYKGEDNYKNFYIVDTIDIEDPVIIRNTSGCLFICSEATINSIRIDKSFFYRPDVFILGNNLYDDLAPSDYEQYYYPDFGNCSIVSLDTLSRDKPPIQKYKYNDDSVRFILGLINVNYHNKTHQVMDGCTFSIRSNDPKNSYYKIVYPICKYRGKGADMLF